MSYSMEAQNAKNSEEDKFRKLQSIYRGNSTKLMNFRKEVDTHNLFKKNQDDLIDRNTHILNNLRNDILTLRRQAQIGENQFRKRSFYLFILKNMLSILLLSIVVALLVKTNILSRYRGLSIIGILGLVMVGIIVFNYVINRNINKNLYTKRDWEGPSEEEIEKSPYVIARSEEDEKKCKKCPKCVPQEEEEEN